MVTYFWRAVALTLLLLVPSAGAASAAGDDPKNDKKVVLEEDPIVLHRSHPARQGYLGIQLIEMTPELRAHYGAPRSAGVLVGGVEAESPASKAGLEVGDIITKVDGESIESTQDLSGTVRAKKAGDTVTIEVSRNRASKSLTATIAERAARHERSWTVPDLEQVKPLLGRLGDMRSLRERLDEIEKRLDDLEKKRSAR
jgi:C-terminal processing protease CtpA/Prc